MQRWLRRSFRLLLALAFLFGSALLIDAFIPVPDPELRERLSKATFEEVELLVAEEVHRLGVTALSVTEISGDAAPRTLRFARAERGGLMQVASLSKTVAAAVILIVAEEQGVDLDDDVRGQINSLDIRMLEGGLRPLTLRQLLSHTSGASQAFYVGFERGDATPTTAEVIEAPYRIYEVQLRFDGVVGEFRYAGGGYTIAQLWAEDLLGAPFSEIAKEKLLEPLGMRQSTFEQPLRRSDLAHLTLIGADAHFDPTEGVFHNLDDSWNIYPEKAAAGLWSTSRDYAIFAAALLDAASDEQSPIPKSVAVEMLSPQVETGYETGSYYGLGTMLQVGRMGKVESVSHSGANAGYRAYFIAQPKREDRPRRIVTVIGNTSNSARLIKAIGAGLLAR